MKPYLIKLCVVLAIGFFIVVGTQTANGTPGYPERPIVLVVPFRQAEPEIWVQGQLLPSLKRY